MLPASLLHYAGPPVEGPHGAACDSRRVTHGDLFFDFTGGTHAEAALTAGAGGIVTAAPLPEHARAPDVAYFTAADPRAAYAETAGLCYPHGLRFLGAVTGTNGKTSVTRMFHHFARACGERAVTVGTLGAWAGDDLPAQETGLTSPDAGTLCRLLRDYRTEHGATCGMIEASSHGLDQRRTDGARYDVGLFTNLTQDHLDYHPDMEAYFTAKLRLISLLKPGSLFIYNADMPEAERIRAECLAKGARPFSVGEAAGADLRLLSKTGDLLRFEEEGRPKSACLPLTGNFQSRNALFALRAAEEAFPGKEERLRAAVAELPEVPGRLQRTRGTGAPFGVFVDYAHTPDALENALRALRAETTGRLIVVFGCGGDRDPFKRPLMGACARRLADITVITDDNPRTEDPALIRRAVLEGCARAAEAAGTYSETAGRREAIHAALAQARPGDAVLLAGKGHETYQEIHGVKYPFSDAEEALSWLKQQSY